ncbi:MAG: VOC family protein [Bacteroidales bacterium]|nr:VOC family protein [Bacteroidales bacterium]MBN2749996.1 VOC family protein [Bacteroidales bacterium]
MRIDHIAIWVKNLDKMVEFYCQYLNGVASDIYHNPKKGFTSQFVSFADGARLELMHTVNLEEQHQHEFGQGLTHLAFSVGSKEMVNNLTNELRAKGNTIISEPRTTGDGYYESVALDPEGNYIEITI